MREIKFKALLDSGKWIYITIHPGHRKFEGGSDQYVGTAKLVTPWLQMTGLKDRNGQEIFEGDVLKTQSGDLINVGWHNTFASFCLNKRGWAHSHFFHEAVEAENCEVISNIHENKELLEKEARG